MKLIMIVEDSPTELKLAEHCCHSGGYRTVSVSSGDEVYSIAKEEKPDLILLDIILPNKNGYQVCRQLKKDSETKDIKIIMVSSKDQKSDKFWGMKQGADDYITKPYDETVLTAAIKKCIE